MFFLHDVEFQCARVSSQKSTMKFRKSTVWQFMFLFQAEAKDDSTTLRPPMCIAMEACPVSSPSPFTNPLFGSSRDKMPVSVKKTLLQRRTLGNTGFQSSNSGAGEHFPPMACRARARRTGVLFLFTAYAPTFCLRARSLL